jgi:hypothetical protein
MVLNLVRKNLIDLQFLPRIRFAKNQEIGLRSLGFISDAPTLCRGTLTKLSEQFDGSGVRRTLL